MVTAAAAAAAAVVVVTNPVVRRKVSSACLSTTLHTQASKFPVPDFLQGDQTAESTVETPTVEAGEHEEESDSSSSEEGSYFLQNF